MHLKHNICYKTTDVETHKKTHKKTHILIII